MKRVATAVRHSPPSSPVSEPSSPLRMTCRTVPRRFGGRVLKKMRLRGLANQEGEGAAPGVRGQQRRAHRVAQPPQHPRHQFGV